MMTVQAQPVLVFDGDCGFCTSCVSLLERIGTRAEMVPWQRADLPALGLTEEEAESSVQWVEAGDAIRSGHEAIAAALGSAGGIWAPAGRSLLLPGISPLAARAYRLVTDNRHRLPGGTPACAAAPQETRRSTSRSIFARRLALSLPFALAVAWILSPSRKRSSTRGSI